MTYTVKYKRRMFWKTVKAVNSDSFLGSFRCLYLEDGSALMIPTAGTFFEFSAERAITQRSKGSIPPKIKSKYLVKVGRLKFQCSIEYGETPCGHASFLTADDKRIEIPNTSTIEFGAERRGVIEALMGKQAGAQVQTN